MWNFSFAPVEASTYAHRVDLIFLTLTVLSTLLVIGVVAAILYFAVKYRSGREVDRTPAKISHLKLEVTWIVIPFFLGLGLYVWAAWTYFGEATPPPQSMDIYVTAKQWMWKVQHPEGMREIDELHVPVGQPVRLLMTSEDVIHSFYVPAFRMKHDVLPGRYTSLWFQATKPGRYHLFCAEYCGTSHSMMLGSVVVMEPAQYQAWLKENSTPNAVLPDQTPTEMAGKGPADPMAVRGEALFQSRGCNGCHGANAHVVAPALRGVFGNTVQLASGETITADEQYVMESILDPQAKVVAGYEPIMPTFQGLLSTEELAQLVTYVKYLGSQEAPAQEQQ